MRSASTSRLAIVVLTLNEEVNLQTCLESLRGLQCEIYVVDSGSTDGTVATAKRAGATVVEHPFETHARQWAWALKNLPISAEWVLALDADQRITSELRTEIRQLFQDGDRRLGDLEGLYVKRRQVFRGQWIRHGGYYPKYMLKLFRKASVHTDEDDLIDHHFYVSGNVANLECDIIEDNQKENDMSFWIEKHSRYAEPLAREEYLRRTNLASWPIKPDLFGNPDQRVMWMKRLWYRLPLYIRPFGYFVYRYVFRLGFLDGKQGFVFHFMQALWYRLLIDIHIDEMQARDKRQDG